jgi:hypothetical protein
MISPSALISTKYEIILPLCGLLYPRTSPLIFVRSTSSIKFIRSALLNEFDWPIEAGHFTVIGRFRVVHIVQSPENSGQV